jgi:hypothetical protein
MTPTTSTRRGGRPARWISYLAVFLAVVLVPAGAALVSTATSTARENGALAALAAPARPSIHLMPGDRTATVAWAAATGAARYQVRYSTSSSMAGARSVSARSGAGTAITGLVNNRTYFVQVVAISAGGATSKSAVASARPVAGYPSLLTVRARPAGVNQIRVSWTGQTRATKVAVIAGSDGGLASLPFNSSFYPATTSSIVLTVPGRYAAELGSGSGNPIFVKVATYNSATAGTSLPRTKSIARAYRLSLAGTYTYAGGIVAPEGASVRVSEWNVNSVAATRDEPGYRWKDRRTKVAAGIVASGASVVTTAELTTADAGLGTGVTQVQDLANLLKPHGYALANQPGPAGTNATKGAHIFYQPSLMTRLGGGMISPKAIGVAWPKGLTLRYDSWAKFSLRSTGTVFYVVAVHLPADSGSTSYRSLRVAEAEALDAFISAKAGMHTVVVAGDFNSTFLTTGTDPAIALRARGYYDTSSASTRTNRRISTTNITRQVDNLSVPGYPTRPYVYQYPAPRIDYILAKNASGSRDYVNQVILSGGKFDPRYQGSDHNLQSVDVVLRPSSSGWLKCGTAC